MTKFEPTIEFIKQDVTTYLLDDKPVTITDEQAEQLMNKDGLMLLHYIKEK